MSPRKNNMLIVQDRSNPKKGKLYKGIVRKAKKKSQYVHVIIENLDPTQLGRMHELNLDLPFRPGNRTSLFLTACGIDADTAGTKVCLDHIVNTTIGMRFGGLMGLRYLDDRGNATHYTGLQDAFDLIKDCYTVDPNDFIPARYDPEADGEWHPVLDGLIVSIDGGNTYSRCHQQEVDWVNWDQLRKPNATEGGKWYATWGAIDPQGRTMVPYAFGTDQWADYGNANVIRHDNDNWSGLSLPNLFKGREMFVKWGA